MKPDLKQKLREKLLKSKTAASKASDKPAVDAKAPVPTKPKAKLPPKPTQNKVNKSKSSLSSLQEKMKEKLDGSKFRWINETLYTTESQNAIGLFKKQPELFEIVFHS